MEKRKPIDAPNFLTCPVPGLGSTMSEEEGNKAPAPKSIPFEQHASAPSRASTPLRRIQPSVASPTLPPPPPPPRRVKAEKPPKPPRSPRKRFVRWTVAIVIILLLAAISPAAVAFTRAGWSVAVAKNALTRAAERARAGDMTAASAALNEARVSLADARDALKNAGFWRDIPGLGTQVRALEDAASAGATTLDGIRDLTDVAGNVLDAASSASAVTGELVNPVEAHRSFEDLTPEEKRAILAKLSRALPDIREAQAKVSVALDTWNRIPQNNLVAPLRTALAPVADNLPRLKRSLDEAVPLLELFVPLAGYPAPAEYLVVLQNQDEIRATGGFLGTWGLLSVDGGDISTFEFNDVYSLDNPASGVWKESPPAPLRERLGVNAWFFRDANWSPDFPTSAERMMDFYVRETKAGTGKDVGKPNGVIALNPPFFEGLLRMSGPLTVDDVTFTADNFFEKLEYEVEQRFLEQGIPHDKRKGILLKLGDALLAKLTSLPASQWPDLLDLATKSLDNKQIQVYARDPALLARLDAFGWTGRTKPTDGDFVWVIDSNLAALKTDGIMTKRVEYSLDATNPDRPVATVTLRYTNNGPGIGKDYRYTRYRDYVRVYVPEGAQLLEVKGAMKDDRYRTGGRVVAGTVDTYKELGKTVFGAFWSIEPKATQEISFRYRLPAGVPEQLAEGRYHLDIPKQSGNDDGSLTLDLRFGKTVRRAEPSEDPSRFGDAQYQVTTDSSVDRAFDISF